MPRKPTKGKRPKGTTMRDVYVIGAYTTVFKKHPGMGFWGQNSIRAQALFQPLVEEGLFPERVPMFNVENACATASTAFMGAWKDVLAGTHELTFCVGVEKLFSPDHPSRTAAL